jgi:hypothetical protein
MLLTLGNEVARRTTAATVTAMLLGALAILGASDASTAFPI